MTHELHYCKIKHGDNFVFIDMKSVIFKHSQAVISENTICKIYPALQQDDFADAELIFLVILQASTCLLNNMIATHKES